MRVASLHRHPLKGGAIEDLQRMEIGPAGPHHDRNWMVVDANDRFVSQREMPALARVSLRATRDAVTMELDGVGFPVALSSSEAKAFVWGDKVTVSVADAATNDALSAYLERPVRLVSINERTERTVDDAWGTGPVTLADGYPILAVLAASLEALNAAIAWNGGSPVPMARFRPNIVIEGADAWADDTWSRVRIGDAVLDFVKPCARCTVTTVDQDTGRSTGDEPLQTLRAIRMSADRRVPGILFGWNATVVMPGQIAVGDACEVVAARDPWPIREAAMV